METNISVVRRYFKSNLITTGRLLLFVSKPTDP